MLSLIYTEREKERATVLRVCLRENLNFAKQYETWKQTALRGGVREKWERYYKHK